MKIKYMLFPLMALTACSDEDRMTQENEKNSRYIV